MADETPVIPADIEPSIPANDNDGSSLPTIPPPPAPEK